MSERFDVLAVHMKSLKVRLIGQDKDGRNAEAVMAMAVSRRGVEEEFYQLAPVGQYRDGDTYGRAG